MHEIQKRVPEGFVDRESRYLGPCRVQERPETRAVRLEYHLGEPLDDLPVTLFAFAEGRLHMLPFRHIAETPHAPDRFPVDFLRLRVPLEDPPVPEFHDIETGFLGISVQLRDPRNERIGVFEPAEDVVDGSAVVSVRQGLLRQPPHRGKLAVVIHNASEVVDDEKPVRSGFERRGEEGDGASKGFLGSPALERDGCLIDKRFNDVLPLERLPLRHVKGGGSEELVLPREPHRKYRPQIQQFFGDPA